MDCIRYLCWLCRLSIRDSAAAMLVLVTLLVFIGANCLNVYRSAELIVSHVHSLCAYNEK